MDTGGEVGAEGGEVLAEEGEGVGAEVALFGVERLNRHGSCARRCATIRRRAFAPGVHSHAKGRRACRSLLSAAGYYELEDAVVGVLMEELGEDGCCSRPSVCEGERRDRAVIACPSMSGGFLRANDRVHPFVTSQ